MLFKACWQLWIFTVWDIFGRRYNAERWQIFILQRQIEAHSSVAHTDKCLLVILAPWKTSTREQIINSLWEKQPKKISRGLEKTNEVIDGRSQRDGDARSNSIVSRQSGPRVIKMFRGVLFFSQSFLFYWKQTGDDVIWFFFFFWPMMIILLTR